MLIQGRCEEIYISATETQKRRLYDVQNSHIDGFPPRLWSNKT